MITLNATALTDCHICSSTLLPHPLYQKSGAKYCPEDGDFFIEPSEGDTPAVIFRPFEKRVFEVPRSKVIAVQKAKRGRPGTIVRCDQTGDVYDSLTQATIAMKLGQSHLCKYINGKTKHVLGYTFTVIDDIDDPPPFVKKPRLRAGGGLPPVRVRCEQTGDIYETLNDAAVTLRLHRQTISRHLKNRSKFPSVQGYSFHIAEKTV